MISLAFLLGSILILCLQTYGLPTVDPGLFVISGVKTCGNSTGYCLLGTDCTLDQDFVADKGGHCGGLKNAFTPTANFVCCSDKKKLNEVEESSSKGNSSTSSPLLEIKDHVDVDSIDITTEAPDSTTFEIAKDYLMLDNDINTMDAMASSPINTCDACNSTVRFMAEGSQICLGSHIGKGWVVTSASCSMITFRIGMVNVVASFLEEPEVESPIRTIVVNENYKTSASNILLPEANNLGLIQLNNTMDGRCVPCLPIKGQKFGGQMCRTLNNSTDPDESVCESEVETIIGDGKEEFLTTICDSITSPSYYGGEQDSGKPLMCGGHLAGVETSSGIGMEVFTQLSIYMDWIRQNIQPAPMQTFKTP
uniref:Anionic trypsin-2 n=1 Tax=Lygus hesperus TaxID=30085 RepID=A0A146KJT6_LYGHE